MSGSFTQRGTPALLPAHARAEMALRCGADIVLQLPYAFSVREGEYFALGGVHILNSLSCVTHISFGCETDDLPLLKKAAYILEEPTPDFEKFLRSGLDQGLSHAHALGKAAADALSLPPGTFHAPNTALALCYLRALKRLSSKIMPVPVKREYAYHASELEYFPSATAVRGAILRGDWKGVKNSIPAAALPALKSALAQGICPPYAIDGILRSRLLLASAQELSALPGVSEGLEMRILQGAEKAASRAELIEFVKTRRYTQGRISRALCHLMMDVKKSDLPLLPEYARILGFRKGAQPLLRQMQKSGFTLISRPARNDDYALDIRADEMRQICINQPRGETYRRAPIILP